MFDDRDNQPGDVVHPGNELDWRRKFADDTGHNMECIEETVEDMANLVSKTCIAFGNLPIEEIIDQIGVEEFDRHIRAILKTKDCNCNK